MSKENCRRDTVFAVTGKMVTVLNSMVNTPSGKATLANLRNSIGSSLSQSIDIWPLVFQYFPDSFLGQSGEMTKEEHAVITALQLYALHQQGKAESVVMPEEEPRWNNMGYSLSFLRAGDNTVSTDRRFNAMITATTVEELTHYLRQMISLLKAKTSAKVHYAQLAEDLYWYERGYEEKLRLNWARAYYSTKQKGEKNED